MTRVVGEGGQARAGEITDGHQAAPTVARPRSGSIASSRRPTCGGRGSWSTTAMDQADDSLDRLSAARCARPAGSCELAAAAEPSWGSEFSYGDLNIPALDEFDYKLVKTEACGSEQCWVIDVLPKSKETADSEGYSKKTFWVKGEAVHVVQGRPLRQGDGKPSEESCSAQDVKLLDPKNKRYRAMHMEMMTNKQNGRKSVFDDRRRSPSPPTPRTTSSPRRTSSAANVSPPLGPSVGPAA